MAGLAGYNSKSVTIKPDTTVKDLISWLGKLPLTAKVDVHEEPYINQFDFGSKSISVNWTDKEED